MKEKLFSVLMFLYYIGLVVQTVSFDFVIYEYIANDLEFYLSLNDLLIQNIYFVHEVSYSFSNRYLTCKREKISLKSL